MINQTGEFRRICSWVSQAWVEIQEHIEDWEWMRFPCSFNTVALQQTYTPVQVGINNFGRWRTDSFRSYLTAAGVGNEIPLQQYDYNSFRDYYLLGARKTVYSRPIAIAVAPNKSLVLGLAPNDVYTVSGEYYQTPQVLAQDTDVPNMPSRFHMAIVHKSILKYGAFNAAYEVIQEHQQLYSAVLNKLEADQAPTITTGGSFI